MLYSATMLVIQCYCWAVRIYHLDISFRSNFDSSYCVAIFLIYLNPPAALTVGFGESAYSATEGQDIVFTVVLSGEAAIEVTVEFSTSDGSAMG